MSAQPARLLAFRVLREVEAGLRRRTRSATPDSLLARFESGASEADRALARELAFGVLRQRRALDHALDGFARRPLAGLDPALLVLLRMGLYQLRMLTRIPPHAAVHETVGLAREVARPGADRMVNAILRAYLRSDFPWPRPGGDPRLWLRVGLSHPDWMVDRFVAELGEAGAIARMEANNRVPRSFLRVSRRVEPAEAQERLLADGVRTRPFSMAPRCLAVQSGAPFRAAAHRDGLVHIQDAGSQLIAWLLPLAGAKRVLDACAAPGGKAGILAERLHPQRAVAADLRPHRVELLRRIAGRLGVENLSFVSADAGRPPFPPRSFDRILLDAPCSGLGTLARNPDLKWNSSPKRVSRLARTELRLARAAAGLLRPGGLLLYSVCSLDPEETGDLVRALAEGPDALETVPLGPGLPESVSRFRDGAGALRILPEESETDGYFAALMRRPLA